MPRAITLVLKFLALPFTLVVLCVLTLFAASEELFDDVRDAIRRGGRL